MSWFYRLVYVLVKVLMPLVARLEVNGLENVPRQGPVVVVANHQSGWDILILGIVLRRQVHFMGKQELWHIPIAKHVFTWLGSFPVRRGAVDRRALRQATQVLQEGRVLGIFPEGTRHQEGMGDAKRGAALLALRASAPLLPVGLVNTPSIRLTWRFWQRPRVQVNIGQVFVPSEVEAVSRKERLDLVTDMIAQRIAALLPQERRGVWRPSQPSPSSSHS